MSYLNLPRIQFGGLFFTAPSTINNIQHNYHENVQLENSQGLYKNIALWNPTGVAQLWLAECTVLSATGPDGNVLEASSSDPIVGARVETPSPETPKQSADGKGILDIAKLVDLDPLQQGRTRGYGFHIFVTLPDGGGFSGPMPAPELRYMYPRVSPVGGSWSLVGNWQTAIAEEELTWFGDISSSPFLQQFRAACSQGVSFKVAIDLHQNNPDTQFTAGDMFCYGRATGSFGPVEAGELKRAVPGRVLYTYKPPQFQPEAVDESMSDEARETRLKARMSEVIGKTLDEMARDTPTELLESEAIQPQDASDLHAWNPAFAQVSQMTNNDETIDWLSLDLSFAIQLETTADGGALGKFEVNSGITVGYMKGSSPSDFVALTNGAVSFEDKYTWHESQNKNCYLVDNAGIVDIRLEGDEVGAISERPLAVRLENYGLVIQEPSQGYYIDFSYDSLRLYSTEAQQIEVMVRRFGQPLVGIEPPLQWSVYTLDSQTQQQLVASSDVQVTTLSKTDSHGLAQLQVVATEADLPIPAPRSPLDSLMFFAVATGTSGQPISDASYTPLTLSMLYWPQYTAPDNPTWDDDVQPILFAYARLYPGMKGRLDISDESTVKFAAKAMYWRMDPAIFDNPAYMPVTRDLAPPKAQMIRAWLKPFV